MPKAPRRSRLAAHAPPIRPSSTTGKGTLSAQRDFSIPEKAEKVEEGSKAHLPASAILAQNTDPPPQHKKDRLTAKHEALLSKLSLSSSSSHPTAPYALSKSALKRYKRKLRDSQTLPLSTLEAALAEVGEEVERDEEKREEERSRVGKIGEGAGKGLGERERRRVLEKEAKQVKAVLNDPIFRANPFAAIRQHAANTLLKREREDAT